MLLTDDKSLSAWKKRHPDVSDPEWDDEVANDPSPSRTRQAAQGETEDDGGKQKAKHSGRSRQPRTMQESDDDASGGEVGTKKRTSSRRSGQAACIETERESTMQVLKTKHSGRRHKARTPRKESVNESEAKAEKPKRSGGSRKLRAAQETKGRGESEDETESEKGSAEEPDDDSGANTPPRRSEKRSSLKSAPKARKPSHSTRKPTTTTKQSASSTAPSASSSRPRFVSPTTAEGWRQALRRNRSGARQALSELGIASGTVDDMIKLWSATSTTDGVYRMKSYEGMTKAWLKTEATNRGLKNDGTSADLEARLLKDNEEMSGEQAEGDGGADQEDEDDEEEMSREQAEEDGEADQEDEDAQDDPETDAGEDAGYLAVTIVQAQAQARDDDEDVQMSGSEDEDGSEV
jgi:hypothetical protein